MSEISEAQVEERLRKKLMAHGFKVLKLTCPGTNAVPDRMILRPKWSPGPAWYIELKRPKKHERRAQELRRLEWREHGLNVLDPVNSYEQVDELVQRLYHYCNARREGL